MLAAHALNEIEYVQIRVNKCLKCSETETLLAYCHF